MTGLIVAVMVLGCAAFQYFKGTLLRAFAAIIAAICASVIAFGYFEAAAGILIGREFMTPWAHAVCFAVLFILSFAVLNTAAIKLTDQQTDMGFLPEHIGRAVCGAFTGLILSGLFITALAIAPLGNDKPYQRFDSKNPDPQASSGSFISTDSFAVGFFSMISRGSLSGSKSFAVLHPDFLDQIFLNRHSISKKIPATTIPEAIEMPAKTAVWPAELKDQDGKQVPSKPGYDLMIVRTGINKKNIIKQDFAFTLSQLRVVCKKAEDAQYPLTGKGINAYSIGYMKTTARLQLAPMDEEIRLTRDDFDEKVKWIDFAFYIPSGYIPVIAELKQNGIALTPPPVTAQQAPEAMPLMLMSKCAVILADVKPVESAKIYGVALGTEKWLLGDLSFELDEKRISDPNYWRAIQTPQSAVPARWIDNTRIGFVMAEINLPKTAAAAKPEKKKAEGTKRNVIQQKKPPVIQSKTTAKKEPKPKTIGEVLRPMDGYELFSLKCNNPQTGSVVKGEQLPVLIEQSGAVHHAVGIVAAGTVKLKPVCELDYCSLTEKDDPNGLTIADDGSIAKTFPENIWLTEQADTITDFYVLYAIKSGRNTVITAVKPADQQTGAGFEKYESFFVK